MITFIKRLLKDESGQGLSEYGLIIGLVAIALVVALGLMTGALKNIFNAITEALNLAPETEAPVE
ncbi:MAG: Flp family type IVb pilin [Bacillota bacterium]